MTEEIEKTHTSYKNELKRLNYAESTQEIYPSSFLKFLCFFKTDFENITKKQITDWLFQLVSQDKISPAYQNHLINAIKFYYEKMLGKPREFYLIERPRKEFHIPDLLSDNELQRMFDACKYPKHKLVLSLLYGCGLRRSEVRNLKIEHISENYIHIVQSKGKKDRHVPLPGNIKVLIAQYIKEFNSVIFLFNGQDGALQYSAKSIEKVVKRYFFKAGITKRAYPHLLRHNFITEHCEADTNSMKLMEIVGHGSAKTLQRYYHFRRNVNDIQSPINKINL